MKKITMTLLTVLMTMTVAFGQTQEATTADGKKELTTDVITKMEKNAWDSIRKEIEKGNKIEPTETDPFEGEEDNSPNKVNIQTEYNNAVKETLKLQNSLNDQEKVILNSDGTWKYAEVENDTAKVNSSDCSNWIATKTDKVSGITFTAAKNGLIVSADGKTGFGIFMIQSPKGRLILVIRAVGAGSCIDKGAKINILFTDGSRLELASEGDFNCKREATVYFGDGFGEKKQLEELKTKKIQTMRVWTSDSYVEKDFTTDNQEEFYNVINCLTK